MKSIRSNPKSEAAEGDERNRTAGRGLGTSYTYDQFGAYLAGLTDGEGCFSISRNGVNAYKTEFLIHLRADDRPLLDWLCEESGIGKVYVGRRTKQGTDQPSFRWAVTRRPECLHLVAFFERYPLRSKKAKDFAIWSEATRAWSRQNFVRMGEMFEAIRAARFFDAEGVAWGIADEPFPQLELGEEDPDGHYSAWV